MKQLNLTREDLKPGGRWRRIALVLGLPLAVFIGVCFVPMEKEVTRRSAVEIAEPEIIHPELGGFVSEIFVKEGDVVKPGQLVARLSNRDLTERLALAQADVERFDLAHSAALGIGKTDEMRQYAAMREAARTVLEKAKHDVAQLDLRAKTGGVVLTRDLQQRVGLFLKPPQDGLCEVASLNPIRIKVPLSEHEVRYVRPGNPVTLIANAYPDKRFHGRVAGEPLEMDPHNFPPAFSKERGGDVPTFHDQATGKERLLEHTYVVTVEVENPGNLLRYGMAMRAKISTGKQLYGKMVLQWFTNLISLDYRF